MTYLQKIIILNNQNPVEHKIQFIFSGSGRLYISKINGEIFGHCTKDQNKAHQIINDLMEELNNGK